MSYVKFDVSCMKSILLQEWDDLASDQLFVSDRPMSVQLIFQAEVGRHS